MASEKRWLTVHQIARAFGVSEFIARACLRRGEIPGGCLLPSGKWICDADLFEEWAAKRPSKVVVEKDPPCVYFLQRKNDSAAPIKIGVSTQGGLARRLKSIQTGYPHKLVILATMAGGAEAEKRLHESFGHARMNGEWFEPTEGLLALIEGLR